MTKISLWMKATLIPALFAVTSSPSVANQPIIYCENSNVGYMNHGHNTAIIMYENKSKDWYQCDVKCGYENLVGTIDAAVIPCSGIMPPNENVKMLFCARSAPFIGGGIGNSTSKRQTCKVVPAP